MLIERLRQAYGLPAARVRSVSGAGGDVYRITPGAGDRHQDELCLRLYPAGDENIAAIADELRWLQALADAGLQVPLPVADVDGGLQHCWPQRADAPPRRAVVLRWVHGRQCVGSLRPRHLHQVGVLAARMHAVADALQAQAPWACGRAAYDGQLALWAEGRRPGAKALGPAVGAAARTAAQRLSEVLSMRPRAVGAWGRVHGDLHLWYLLHRRGEAGAIDFSDGGLGPVNAMGRALP